MGRWAVVTPLLFLLAFAGCVGPAVLQVDEPGPARSPEAVEVLLDSPDRPFRTVAVIRSTRRNVFRDIEDLKEQVREEAAAVGADAVILSLASEAGTEPSSGVTSDGEVVITGGKGGDTYVAGRAIVFVDG